MSQEYINRLLRKPENRVQGECVICLEAYNTMNTTTGVIEAGVRLSCGHTVGSACIATWFQDNNSCPLCRKTFFPRQPQPYLQHGIMDDRGSRAVTVPTIPELPASSLTREVNIGQSQPLRVPTIPELPARSLPREVNVGQSMPVRVPTGVERAINLPRGAISRWIPIVDPSVPDALTHPRHLQLSAVFGDPVRNLAVVAEAIELRMGREDSMAMLRTQDLHLIEAASFYMASHLLRRPRSPEDTSIVFGIDPEQIRTVYRQGYPIRTQFISALSLHSLAENNVSGFLEYLPRPDGESRDINQDERRRDLQHRNATPQRLINETHDLCYRHRGEFGCMSAYLLSDEISKVVMLGPHIGLRSPAYKAAIALYMAAHLLGRRISSQRTAEVIGIGEDTFKAAYARVYPVRDQLLKPTMVHLIGADSMPRALAAIPALNWPPFES